MALGGRRIVRTSNFGGRRFYGGCARRFSAMDRIQVADCRHVCGEGAVRFRARYWRRAKCSGRLGCRSCAPHSALFFPPIASRLRVQGTPVIAVCILIDGSVPDAASAALVESGQWHFVPAPGGINGTPEWKDIAVTYSMPGTAPSSPPDSDADLPKSAKHETAQLGTEGMTRPTTDPGFPHGSRYSVLALRHGDQGKVVVSMAIGSDGWISEAKIDQSSGSDQLDAAALVSVGYWHYFPATRNGTALVIPWKARVVFKLSDMPPGAARSVH